MEPQTHAVVASGGGAAAGAAYPWLLEEPPPAPSWALPRCAAAPATDALSAELLAFEAWASLSPAEAGARDALVTRAGALAVSAFGHDNTAVVALAFGSHAAGLASFHSDTDIELRGLQAGATLHSLAAALQRCGWANDVTLIATARACPSSPPATG